MDRGMQVFQKSRQKTKALKPARAERTGNTSRLWDKKNLDDCYRFSDLGFLGGWGINEGIKDRERQ